MLKSKYRIVGTTNGRYKCQWKPWWGLWYVDASTFVYSDIEYAREEAREYIRQDSVSKVIEYVEAN